MPQLTLNFALAAQARDLGLDLVEANNEGFVALMRRVAKALCAKKGSVTCDDLRKLAEEWGLNPDHQNAWGAIFRGRGWRVIGRQPSAVKSNHARELKVWTFEESRA